ncbi:peptidase S1 domain protein [Metarhizium robertsii]|uniref:Peptidase S1/S6, chymotrypsin/Hap, active site protein n=2 Tax=Metarhizium robertsii TaxID=568076 RepID=E9F913_METRA|nr:Peptidase S1/S6, chymotrypsin/Hap, active site protein [Metarhizium robertsii ARSEF 23]EFY95781.1 Peptidase S1/S6, chymotrypsin/Hap, active site protein [Metarhizium robertsii ARSEF 23]EXU96924.1 peptidase S1 domain protein [Metarhizium robertsii]
MLLAAVTTVLWAITSEVSAATATRFEGIPSVGVLYTHSPKKHMCTGAVVASKPGNMIITAAHCMRGDGKHLRFAPGYHDGSTPYGTYPVTGAYIHNEWNKTFSINHDYAILTLGNATINGRSVTVQKMTGGNKIDFSPSYKNVVKVFGYNLNEEKPMRCTTSTYRAGEGQLGFNCGPFRAGTSGSVFMTKYSNKKMLGTIVGNIGGWQGGGCSDSTSYSAKYSSGLNRVFDEASNSTGKTDCGWVVRGGAPKYC